MLFIYRGVSSCTITTTLNPPWLRPIVGQPGVWTQARPPSFSVTHCSLLCCDIPSLLRLHLDIWPSSNCHLFLWRDCAPNWDPWYAHLLAALAAACHVMWQTKLCTQYCLRFPIKDEQEEWAGGCFSFPFHTLCITLNSHDSQKQVVSLNFILYCIINKHLETFTKKNAF